MRKIIHIDMDCFYAAIEMRDNPSLIEKPIAVGGSPSSRGVVCTSNYVARRYGVRSAMSSAYAKKLCPDLIILPVAMDKYRALSKSIRQIFYEYTALVEPLSLDEAYLDVTQCSAWQNSATLIAKEIRQKIFDRHQLTASAGVAGNKFLAKVASDLNKPNGQYVITPEQVSSFIKILPIDKLFGVGKVTAAKLEQMGVKTCSDLQSYSREKLINSFGKFGNRLYDMVRGIDPRAVEPLRPHKSVSVENTFVYDLLSLDACLGALPNLYEALIKRLSAKKHPQLHKQFVKIKFNNFKTTNVEVTCCELSFEHYERLIEMGYLRQERPVRLLGLGVGFKQMTEVHQKAFDFGRATYRLDRLGIEG